MTDLLTLGASGLRAYRAAIAGVSENIANADDPNYVRRNVRLSEAPANAAVNPIYLRNNDFHGSVIGGVERQTDQFADAGLRRARADIGQAAARVRWVSAAETALGDGPSGVGARLGAFFDAGDRLAALPSDTGLRTDMLARLDFAVHGLNQTAARLDQAAQGTQAAAGEAVSTINQTVDRLAAINTNLLRATPGTQSHAALLDQRDAALGELAEIVPMDLEFGSHGTVALSLNGVIVLAPGAQGIFALALGSGAQVSLTVDGVAVALPDGGALSGLAGAADVIAVQRGTLDALANGLSTTLNTWNTSGLTPVNAPGGPLLVGSGAAELALVSQDPLSIAAASLSSANGNLLALGAYRNSAGGEAQWTGLVQAGALIVLHAQANDAAATSLYEQASAARDQISGVDMDREAADLLRLQQAYEASARILQVARDTLQSILNIF
jgi:flagellar hook-associated protein 1